MGIECVHRCKLQSVEWENNGVHIFLVRPVELFVLEKEWNCVVKYVLCRKYEKFACLVIEYRDIIVTLNF